MRNIIKIIAFTIIALSIGAITGCTDFPDEYAVDASVGEIRMKDDAKLSEDGKSYTATVLVDFDIRENTFNKISSALVYINGTEYDVTDQLNPNTGGTAEIPCAFDCMEAVWVTATLNVSAHSFDNGVDLLPYSFDNDVKKSTGDADEITPYSAVLHVDVDYPWLTDCDNFYMMVSSEKFSVPVNSNTDNFNGQVLYCTHNIYYGYSNYDIKCSVNNLNANTIYYYQMVRLDPDSKAVSFAGETKTFKTEEATAKISTLTTNVSLIGATIEAMFDPGNLEGVYRNGGKLVWRVAESADALETSVGSTKLSYGNTYEYTFKDLSPGTKYYYRCDFCIGEGIMCSSDIKEFTTIKSTASLTVTMNAILDKQGEIGVNLDKGNVEGLIYNNDYVKIFYGESKDNMNNETQSIVGGKKEMNLHLYNLYENKKYYYKACYYVGNSILASTEIKEFTTCRSSDVTNLGSFYTTSSGKKQFIINARKGSVLAFDYYSRAGSLTAQLSGGSSDVVLFKEQSNGRLYYAFMETGTYTLNFSFTVSTLFYERYVNIPEINFLY